MTAIDEFYPFDAGAGASITENQWRKMAQNWRADGVLPVPVSSITVVASWAVSPNAGMVLNIATGAVTILGHYGGITSTKTVTIAANSSGNPRVDFVVARLDTVANTISVEVLTGTPAATPAAPALTQTSATWEIPIAHIAVANGAVSISANEITDRRNIYPGLTTAPNPVRNASALVWQRGTSVAASAPAFQADGWKGYRGSSVAGMTVSRQLAADFVGSGYCFRVQRDSANASTQGIYWQQSFESGASIPFAGKQVTFSFRARCGADYSSASSVLTGSLEGGTGTDQSLSVGFTGQSSVATIAATLTRTWKTFSVTATAAATITQLGIDFRFTPVGTASTNDYFEVKDIRVDPGDRPLPHTPNPYPVDLAECRWFFRRDQTATNHPVGFGIVTGATTATIALPTDTPMRATPTITVIGTIGNLTLNDAGAAPAVTAFAGSSISSPVVQWADVTAAGGGLTQGRSCRVYTTGTVSVDRSAEI